MFKSNKIINESEFIGEAIKTCKMEHDFSFCWDSVLLENLTEDSFISNLHQRYKRDHIYTYIGTFLVAINPYKPLSLYTPNLVEKYATRGLFKLPPHIYAFTNSAYQWLENHNEDQCIILTGESGSGKTETSRMIINFLSQVSNIRKINTVKVESQQLQKRRSNSVSSSSNQSQTNLTTLTPKHLSNSTNAHEKSGCLIKPGIDSGNKFGSLKKCSHEKTVDFDFSHHKSTENLSSIVQPIKCQKHSSIISSNLSDKLLSSVPTPTTITSNAAATSNLTTIMSCPKHNSSSSLSSLSLKYSDNNEITKTLRTKCNSCLNKTNNIDYHQHLLKHHQHKHNNNSTSTLKLHHQQQYNTVSEQHLLSCNKNSKSKTIDGTTSTLLCNNTNINSKTQYTSSLYDSLIPKQQISHHYYHHNKHYKTSLEYLDSEIKLPTTSIQQDELNTKCNCDVLLSNSRFMTPPQPQLSILIQPVPVTGLLTSIKTTHHEKPKQQRESSGSKYVEKNTASKVAEIINANIETQQIKECIVHADIFLEALGNASTIKNVNSSRFGKFYDIEFDFKGDPIRGNIMHYMLEKSRIIQPKSGERNFHIFYQLLAGADIQFLKSLKLQRNIDKYELLKHGTATDDDKKNFFFTKKSLETLLSQDEIFSLFKIVAVVIKLGNLVFVPTTNIDGSEGCVVSNEYELHEAAQLLNIDDQILLNCLTRGDTNWNQLDSFGPELDAVCASRIKNSLCVQLYGRLFTWAINRINDALKLKNYARGKNLGILDFYGFEILENNSFEQLAINYCNERLHQNFLQNVLKMQQELYIREGLEWTHVDFFDNATICELIDKPNYGILSLLEEPQVSCDDTFFTRIHQCCSGNPNFLNQNLNLTSKSFQIRHYAGPVTYCVNKFLEKNLDILPKNISTNLFQSKLSIVQTLFPEGNPKRPSKRPSSLGSYLRTSLQTLLSKIDNRRCHYVFCIKPNENKQSKVFELALVQHQVRYLSLMPLVNLWRSGHYFNIAHSKFLNRYKLLSPITWPHFRKGTLIEGIALIIRNIPLPTAEFTIGRSKVFIRSPRTVFELEEFRKKRLDYLATLIQKTFRCYSIRNHFKKMKNSQIIISSAWRSWRECRYGIPFNGRRHLWALYRVAKEEYRIIKYRKQVEYAVSVLQRQYKQWKRRQFLLTLPLRFTTDSLSPLCLDWPIAPRFLAETSQLLRNIYHRWRCYKYRKLFDQTSRNRLREKVTASIIFKDRKTSYNKSVSHPFLGDYVRLRQNVQWKKLSVESNDQYVVFADIINKITRSSGKFVPILLVLSTSSMLLLDQRTLQVKYRVPATEIYRLSLSPYLDDIAVFHVKASELGKKKGDFVFQTGHVIEIVTKLFLVIQNATNKPPEVHISTEFEANFGQQTVLFTFKSGGLAEVQPKATRKGNRMEIIV